MIKFIEYYKLTIIYIVILIIGTSFSRNLVLTKEGTNERVILTEDGKLKYSGEIKELNNNATIPQSSHMLALFKDDDIKIGINNKEFFVKNQVTPNNPSIPISGDFAFFKSPLDLTTETPQMVVGSQETVNDGDLMIADIAIDIEVPISTVAYVGAEGVFERTWNEGEEGFKFSYANIEGEGRSDYTGGTEKNYYYVTDHLGSTRMVIDEDCNMDESYAYTAYGVMKALEEPSNPTREKFTGKEFDTDGYVDGVVDGMDLFYFGARYYDPVVGVWISVDAAEQFINGYGYPTNPVVLVDPDGNFVLSAAIIGGIFAAGTATINAITEAVMDEQSFGECAWNVFVKSNIAFAVGFVSGGVGAGTSSSLNAAIQAAGGSAFGGATVGGMTAGAISGGVSYTMNYVLQSAFGYQKWGDMYSFTEGLGKSMIIGGAIGLGTGAISHWSTMGADEGTLHHDNVFNDGERGLRSGEASNNHLRFEFKSSDVASGDITDLGVLGELKKIENTEFINFPSNSPCSTRGGIRITGLNKASALKYFNQNGYNNAETYNTITKNCAMAVTKSLTRSHLSTHSPTLDALFWMSRQLIRNMHGM